MSISLIYAVSDNNVIGVGNNLPWRLPDDLGRFRELTLGRPVIMGRKTWESIRHLKLELRIPIVISRSLQDGVPTYTNLYQGILKSFNNDPFIIGGRGVLEEGAKYASRIYLTRVYATIEGEDLVYGPNIDLSTFELASSSEVKEYNGLKYQIFDYISTELF